MPGHERCCVQRFLPGSMLTAHLPHVHLPHGAVRLRLRQNQLRQVHRVPKGLCRLQ